MVIYLVNLVESIYYLGFSLIKHFSLLNRKRLPGRVISIGNLTSGGTGKTPAVMSVAEEAKRRGFCPVILTRGYKGKAKGPCFVTKGEGPLLTAEDAGDEPALMAERLAGIPVVKGGDRYKSGIFAIQQLGTQNSQLTTQILFILDDGFQHRGLYRDKDIVLIDAANPFGNGRLLPLGRLREPVKSIVRADIIVLTKLERNGDRDNPAIEKLIDEIRRYNSKSPIFFAGHIPVYCRFLSGEKKPIGWLSGKKIFGFCALGSPGSFEKTIQSTGAEPVGFKTYKDHYRYNSSDMAKIRQEAERCGAEWIATTEKDIIKIRNIDLPENILIIEVEFAVDVNFYPAVFSL